MAGHQSARTTGLYDRRNDTVTLDEVEWGLCIEAIYAVALLLNAAATSCRRFVPRHDDHRPAGARSRPRKRSAPGQNMSCTVFVYRPVPPLKSAR